MIAESTWLGKRGKPEIQREVVIDKLKTYIPQPKDQVVTTSEEEQYAAEDPDENVTDPSIDEEDNNARLHFIQCKDPPSWLRRNTYSTATTLEDDDWDNYVENDSGN